MKKLIYSMSLLIAMGLMLEAANAQSKFPVAPSNSIPSAPFKVPSISSPAPQAEFKVSTIQVTPNPCNGQFTVRFKSPSGGKTGITVSNRDGSGMVAVEMIATTGVNSVQMDVSQYGSGTYTVTVSGGGMYATVPLIVKTGN